MPSPLTKTYTLPTLSPILRLYYKWRTLPLPWRKRIFIGQDLCGNTYWELRSGTITSSPRARRIVEFGGGAGSLRDKMAEGVTNPQWYQWLRGLRREAPSIEELLGELKRVEVVRERARRLDEIWKEGGRGKVGMGVGDAGGEVRKLLGGKGVVGGLLKDGGGKGMRLGDAEQGGDKVVVKQVPSVDTTNTENKKQHNVVEDPNPNLDPWAQKKKEQEQEQEQAGESWSPRVGKR